MSLKRRLLVDADVVVYRSAFAAQYTVYDLTVDGIVEHTLKSAKEGKDYLEMYEGTNGVELTPRVIFRTLKHATNYCDKLVKESITNTKATSVLCFLSGDENFREAIATIQPYKGNRDELVRPKYYHEMRTYVQENYETVISINCEADDDMAMQLYQSYKHSAKTKNRMDCKDIIGTIDKDLDTVPGWHYGLLKKKVYWVTNYDAMLFFWKQMLIGDGADHIPGIRQWGPAKSQKLLGVLKTEAEMYAEVAKLYQYQYGDSWEEALLEVGRLLNMQKYPGEMWTPKESWIVAANKASEETQ